MSTRKYASSYFWIKLFNLFCFSTYCYFSCSAFLRIFFVSREGPDLWILVGEHKSGRCGGNNLEVNYNSANNTQKKGVSWYSHSSKTGKIPEKYIWRSSSLVNQRVESLQLYPKMKLLLGTFQEFCSNQNLTLFKVACVVKIKLFFYGLDLL